MFPLIALQLAKAARKDSPYKSADKPGHLASSNVTGMMLPEALLELESEYTSPLLELEDGIGGMVWVDEETGGTVDVPVTAEEEGKGVLVVSAEELESSLVVEAGGSDAD